MDVSAMAALSVAAAKYLDRHLDNNDLVILSTLLVMIAGNIDAIIRIRALGAINKHVVEETISDEGLLDTLF